MPADITDIKRLYMRAKAHSKTQRKLGKDVRHIEAFLLQAALLEGVLTNYGLRLLGKQKRLGALKSKRKNWYGFDHAINDLYLLGAINEQEFKELEKFKNKRNNYIHNFLLKKTKVTEEEVLIIYNNYNNLVWSMIERLDKEK